MKTTILAFLLISANHAAAQPANPPAEREITPASCRVLNLTKMDILRNARAQNGANLSSAQSMDDQGGPFPYAFYVKENSNGAITYYLIESPLWNMTDDQLRAKVEAFKRRTHSTQSQPPGAGTAAHNLETVFSPANSRDTMSFAETNPRLAEFEQQHIKPCSEQSMAGRPLASERAPNPDQRDHGQVPSPGAPTATR